MRADLGDCRAGGGCHCRGRGILGLGISATGPAAAVRPGPGACPVRHDGLCPAARRNHFSGNCASCHGDHGQGDRGFGVPTSPIGTGFTAPAGSATSSRPSAMAYSADARGRDLAYMPAYALPVPYDREALHYRRAIFTMWSLFCSSRRAARPIRPAWHVVIRYLTAAAAAGIAMAVTAAATAKSARPT